MEDPQNPIRQCPELLHWGKQRIFFSPSALLLRKYGFSVSKLVEKSKRKVGARSDIFRVAPKRKKITIKGER